VNPFVWVVVALLLSVNALYVAAEFAAVGSRRSRIQQLAQEGSAGAGWLLPVVEQPATLDRFVAACQIGITLSSLVLGAFGQAAIVGDVSSALEGLMGLQEAAAVSLASVMVLVFLGSMQVVLGELVPKSLALQFPTRTLLLVALPMRLSLRFMSWFVLILNGSGRLILRALGASDVGHRHIHSPEEIDLLIAESRDGGLLEPDEHRRLHRALRLSAKTVEQLIVPRVRVRSLDVDAPMEDILQEVTTSPYTRFPVYSGTPDNVIGLLHSRDLAARLVGEGLPGSIEPLLRPVVTVPETLSADQLLAKLRRESSQFAVAFDQHGGMAGIVTLDDVLANVFGFFADEFKGPRVAPEKLGDGGWLLPAEMEVEEAAAMVGADWSGPPYTVGGWVLSSLDHPPAPGDKAFIGDWAIEVAATNGRRLVSVVARPPQQPDEDEQ
jgi:putative hemolysin